MKKTVLPMNLQFFADSAGGVPDGQPAAASGNAQTAVPPVGQGASAAPAFDYDKLASLIQGKQTVAEETVLKSYFKQQGLSQEEAGQAISAFKQQKAAQQPDLAVMQTQLSEAQAAARQAQALAQKAQVETAATIAAAALGLDAKTIPYVLKMADLSTVTGQDGKVNVETVKAAINKVLEDIPQFKPQAAVASGFVQVGAGGDGNAGAAQSQDDTLRSIFGIRKR